MVGVCLDVRLLMKAYRLGDTTVPGAAGFGDADEAGLETVVCLADLITCEGEGAAAGVVVVRRRARDDVKKRTGPTERAAANGRPERREKPLEKLAMCESTWSCRVWYRIWRDWTLVHDGLVDGSERTGKKRKEKKMHVL